MSDADDTGPVDYGPLTPLLGNWIGDQGQDVSPEPDGIEENPYRETMAFEPMGDVTNAEQQILAVIRYQRLAERLSTGKVFHHETGFFTWDSAEQSVVQALTIPRGVCLLAGGTARVGSAGELTIDVNASADSDDWTITESPFMRDNARTVKFEHHLSVEGPILRYRQTTHLEIYGRHFDHTDQNTLVRGPLFSG